MNAFFDWLLSTLIVTSVLAALVLGTARLFRRQPALQHLLWLVVLVRFICPPVFAISIPEWIMPVSEGPALPVESPEQREPLENREQTNSEASASPITIAENQPSEAGLEESSGNSRPPSFARNATRFQWDRAFAMMSQVAILIWLVGSAVTGVIQAARILRLKHCIRLASPAPAFLAEAIDAGAAELGTRPVSAIVLSGISIPLVWCFGRTRLLWPEMLAGRDDIDRCRGAILHELAHVRRRDHWVSWVDLVAGILWWWNPVFWLVRRRLHESAELACDALALSVHDNDRREYAELFLELSLHRMPAFPPGVGLCSGARKLLERRLTMMLSDVVRPSIPRRGWALAIALALVAVPAWSVSRATVAPESSSTNRTATGPDATDSKQTQPGITKHQAEREDPSQTDQKRLQGTWDLVGFVHNDKEERSSFKLYQLTFKDGEVTTNWIREDDDKGGGTSRFTIDATRQPRELLMEGDNLRIQAIYRFEKDQLTLAFFGKPEKTRPQGFTVNDAGDSGDSKLPLIVWKLKRGAPGIPPREDDRGANDTLIFPKGHITARFLYSDTMLLLSSEAGVAAVIFGEPIHTARKQGVRYEYRYESRDGLKKIAGEGELFETRNRQGQMVGKRYIEAGDIRVPWSVADDAKGWIYYSPESLRVQLGNAQDFRDRMERRPDNDAEQKIPGIDLNRFQIPKPSLP